MVEYSIREPYKINLDSQDQEKEKVQKHASRKQWTTFIFKNFQLI